MSWHCSQALVADFSEHGCLDSDQCARLSSIRTAGRSSFAARRKATWNPFPCGTISEHSMVVIGVTLWMSSLRDSRASPSQSRESSSEKTTLETCGPTRSASFAKYDPDSASWKTCPGLKQRSTSGRSWPIWPRAGMASGGIAYELQTAERRTGETGCGYWPTPAARDWKESGLEPAAQARKSPCLPAAVQMKQKHPGGKLNADWVEWLMGWPTGWTALEPLGTGRFQEWLSAHGGD